jgi:hypothetical protein
MTGKVASKIQTPWPLVHKRTIPTERPPSTLRILRSLRRLLITASVVPSSPILVTLMNEALSSSETSVHTRVTRRNIVIVTVVKASNLTYE